MRVANAFSKWHQLNQIVKFSGISNLEGLCSLFNYLIEKLEFPYKWVSTATLTQNKRSVSYYYIIIKSWIFLNVWNN